MKRRVSNPGNASVGGSEAMTYQRTDLRASCAPGYKDKHRDSIAAASLVQRAFQATLDGAGRRQAHTLAASMTSRVQRIALIGLVVNIALALGKLAAGIFGNTYALVADAAESIADIIGSVVIWGGLHIGARPADENHPYGHGKAESLAAFMVAMLIVAAGIGIALKAIDEIRTPHLTPAPWTLIVLVGVVAIKGGLARYARRIARQAGSGAAEVDAGHHWADAVTSAAAFVGITIAIFGQRFFGLGHRWAAADDWAALAASGVIVASGVRLARVPLRELMDAEPTAILEDARRLALATPGVRGLEKTRARTSGGRHYLEMHVEVDPQMTVADAHIITGKIKAAARGAHPSIADVLIHVEPAAPASSVEAAAPAG